jgi:hypothetical protein
MVRLTLPYGPCTVAVVPSASVVSVERTDCVVSGTPRSVDTSGTAFAVAPHPHNIIPVNKTGKILLFIMFFLHLQKISSFYVYFG